MAFNNRNQLQNNNQLQARIKSYRLTKLHELLGTEALTNGTSLNVLPQIRKAYNDSSEAETYIFSGLLTDKGYLIGAMERGFSVFTSAITFHDENLPNQFTSANGDMHIIGNRIDDFRDYMRNERKLFRTLQSFSIPYYKQQAYLIPYDSPDGTRITDAIDQDIETFIEMIAPVLRNEMTVPRCFFQDLGYGDTFNEKRFLLLNSIFRLCQSRLAMTFITRYTPAPEVAYIYRILKDNPELNLQKFLNIYRDGLASNEVYSKLNNAMFGRILSEFEQDVPRFTIDITRNGTKILSTTGDEIDKDMTIRMLRGVQHFERLDLINGGIEIPVRMICGAKKFKSNTLNVLEFLTLEEENTTC